MSYTVMAGFDEEHARYYVISSDIPGLNAEAGSFEDLVSITKDAFPDLVDHQGNRSTISFQRKVELAA